MDTDALANCLVCGELFDKDQPGSKLIFKKQLLAGICPTCNERSNQGNHTAADKQHVHQDK